MKEKKTYIAIIMAMVFWAFSFVWFKIANEVYRPLSIVYFRLILSVIVLSIYLALSNNFMKIKVSDWKWFLLMGFFEPFLYFLGESYGLTYVSSTVASVLISTIPIFAALGGWLFFSEKLKFINYLGIGISFVGVLVFILNKNGSLSFEIKGLLLLMLAVISAVSYSLILRRLAGSYKPIYIVNVQNIIGLVLFLPLFVILELKHMKGFEADPKALLAILQMAIFASCGAFILFGYSVRTLGVAKSNAFVNIIPVLTAVFAWLLIGETLTIQKILGMAIVITGLFLSQTRKKKMKTGGAELAGKTA